MCDSSSSCKLQTANCKPPPTPGAIGFFDSGIGGLSVWRETVALLPGVSTVYLGDEANCPYGGRPADEILRFSRENTKRLLAMGCKTIVLACNTATAAAVDALRREFPAVPFVGMEPAIKTAAARTRTGNVAVLATEGTFRGRLWRETCKKFAGGINVLKTTAPEFVKIVESGELNSPAALETVRAKVAPLVLAGVDEIVLGCTHFPFLKEQIQSAAGDGVEVIDPSPAVARQIARVCPHTPDSASPDYKFITTGEPDRFNRLLNTVLSGGGSRAAQYLVAESAAVGTGG